MSCCGWSCGVAYSLKGQKFGMLQVAELDCMKNQTSYWRCVCECGNEAVVRRGHLTDHRLKSCGCANRGKLSVHWSGCGDISGSLFGKIQAHAKRRGLLFEVTIGYLWKLFQEQNGECALSGTKLTLPGNNLVSYNASLDRIDSSRGYIEGNVQWVHKDVNFMKQRFQQDQFISMCKKIAEWSTKTEKLLRPAEEQQAA